MLEVEHSKCSKLIGLLGLSLKPILIISLTYIIRSMWTSVYLKIKLSLKLNYKIKTDNNIHLFLGITKFIIPVLLFVKETIYIWNKIK